MASHFFCFCEPYLAPWTLFSGYSCFGLCIFTPTLWNYKNNSKKVRKLIILFFPFLANALTMIAAGTELVCNALPNLIVMILVVTNIKKSDEVISFPMTMISFDALLTALIYQFVIMRQSTKTVNCRTVKDQFMQSTSNNTSSKNRQPIYQLLSNLPFLLIGHVHKRSVRRVSTVQVF